MFGSDRLMDSAAGWEGGSYRQFERLHVTVGLFRSDSRHHIDDFHLLEEMTSHKLQNLLNLLGMEKRAALKKKYLFNLLTLKKLITIIGSYLIKNQSTILKQEQFTKIAFLIFTFFPNKKCPNTYDLCVTKHNNNNG